jgi:hypothetical protein
LKLDGEEHRDTIVAANNYASSLQYLEHYAVAKALLRKVTPVARRILGDTDRLTLKMRWIYANSLYKDGDATLDDLREAVATFEETERIARRVLGSAHPITEGVEEALLEARAALDANVSFIREAMEAMEIDGAKEELIAQLRAEVER